MSDFVKKPCQHCPFRTDVRPFLHPRRAEELAYNASNPYGSFACHKTLGSDDEGQTYISEASLECAGHLTMQYAENGRTDYDADGFVPADNCYSEPWEMMAAYEYEWDKRHVS